MTYRLLDSGNGRKLEALGPWTVVRQATQAFWNAKLPRSEWQRARGVHIRSEKGGGHWEWREEPPAEWTIAFGGLRLLVRPTPFGHIGFFPEQTDHWRWLRETIAARAPGAQPARVLNLFAYTGGSTLACAQAGAAVTHVDAAGGIVEWARANAAANGLANRPVRWIVDDCMRFLQREERRGVQYDAVILDPPTFGRGKQGEVWKIEDDILGLLDACRRVLVEEPAFVLLSCHSPGFSGLVLENLLAEVADLSAFERASGEMTVEEATGRPLPSGTFARWRRP